MAELFRFRNVAFMFNARYYLSVLGKYLQVA